MDGTDPMDAMAPSGGGVAGDKTRAAAGLRHSCGPNKGVRAGSFAGVIHDSLKVIKVILRGF